MYDNDLATINLLPEESLNTTNSQDINDGSDGSIWSNITF